MTLLRPDDHEPSGCESDDLGPHRRLHFNDLVHGRTLFRGRHRLLGREQAWDNEPTGEIEKLDPLRLKSASSIITVHLLRMYTTVRAAIPHVRHVIGDLCIWNRRCTGLQPPWMTMTGDGANPICFTLRFRAEKVLA